MQTIQKFLDRPDIKEIQSHDKDEIYSQDFFRDPMRPIYINNNVLYAPADGIVVAAKEMEADEPYDIKGTKFTLQDLLEDGNYKSKSLVISIFMTALDVHVNRVPAACIYKSAKNTTPLHTHGVSMLMMEQDLLEDFKIKPQDKSYMVYNERRISKFYSPAIKGCFYLVQIADKDVDCCITWKIGQPLAQGQRFGQIRFGSQCEMIVPLDKVSFDICVNPLDHVEAGVDIVAEVKR